MGRVQRWVYTQGLVGSISAVSGEEQESSAGRYQVLLWLGRLCWNCACQHTVVCPGPQLPLFVFVGSPEERPLPGSTGQWMDRHRRCWPCAGTGLETQAGGSALQPVSCAAAFWPAGWRNSRRRQGRVQVLDALLYRPVLSWDALCPHRQGGPACPPWL